MSSIICIVLTGETGKLVIARKVPNKKWLLGDSYRGR